MRLPYITTPLPLTNPPAPTVASPYSTTAGIIARLQARRYPYPLLSLDLSLLHAPPLADGWNSFLGALRTGTSLPASIRELAICRVAALNGAAYEWEQHAPLAQGEGEIGDEGMRRVANVTSVGVGEGTTAGIEEVLEDGAEEDAVSVREESGAGLNEKQYAVLAYTDQMTRQIKVDDELFQRLQRLFTPREIVEITATVAGYNCVSRFLVALDVGEMNGKKVGYTSQ